MTQETPTDRMVNIERMTLALPAHLRSRANTIAHEVARHLARTNVNRSVTLATLSVPPVRANGGESDSIIGRRIASAIGTQVMRHTDTSSKEPSDAG